MSAISQLSAFMYFVAGYHMISQTLLITVCGRRRDIASSPHIKCKVYPKRVWLLQGLSGRVRTLSNSSWNYRKRSGCIMNLIIFSFLTLTRVISSIQSWSSGAMASNMSNRLCQSQYASVRYLSWVFNKSSKHVVSFWLSWIAMGPFLWFHYVPRRQTTPVGLFYLVITVIAMIVKDVWSHHVEYMVMNECTVRFFVCIYSLK